MIYKIFLRQTVLSYKKISKLLFLKQEKKSDYKFFHNFQNLNNMFMTFWIMHRQRKEKWNCERTICHKLDLICAIELKDFLCTTELSWKDYHLKLFDYLLFKNNSGNNLSWCYKSVWAFHFPVPWEQQASQLASAPTQQIL